MNNKLNDRLKSDYEDIINYLEKNDYHIEEIPSIRDAVKKTGNAFSIAYAIQGVLKYHGLIDKENRIPYFSSISFNNGSVFTLTYLDFNETLDEDKYFLNGELLISEGFERVKKALDFFREFANINSRALLISRNFIDGCKILNFGKGLGTSASGSAALAIAAISILYNNNNNFIKNRRFISIFSRYLSGSGARSATGGFSLWLSHPTIDPNDCFSIRLDKKEHRSFIDEISLITIPIYSDIKTGQAHEIAPQSPFFKTWLKSRKNKIIEFIEALKERDFDKIGELSEYDTLCLHSITMTGPLSKSFIAWSPETLKLMHYIKKLREKEFKVYFSIDTGPSVVLLTLNNQVDEIIKKIINKFPTLFLIKGKIGGSAKILSENDPILYIFKKEVEKIKKEYIK